jgi:hypothetical protein
MPARRNIQVTLESLVETESGYLVTLRLTNTSADDVGIALKWRDLDWMSASLSDSGGGNCQLLGNGNNWGNFRGFRYGLLGTNESEYFRPVAQGGSGRFTIQFAKRWCASPIRLKQGLSLDAVLVVRRGQIPQDYPISFADVPLF